MPQLLLQTPDQGRQALLLASTTVGEGRQTEPLGTGPVTGRVAANTRLPLAQGRFKSRAQRLFPPQRWRARAHTHPTHNHPPHTITPHTHSHHTHTLTPHTHTHTTHTAVSSGFASTGGWAPPIHHLICKTYPYLLKILKDFINS